MKATRFWILGLAAVASVCAGQDLDGSGWFNAQDDSASVQEFVPDGSVQAQDVTGGAGNSADAITPDIAALARGLMSDPQKIFDYVHNHIDYVHYFGSKKGAELTLLERCGNDFDQCALLVALLRAANYTNVSYQFGVMFIPYVPTSGTRCLTNWMGLAKDSGIYLTNANFFSSFASGARGSPVVYSSTDNVSVGFHRVWVLCSISNQTYQLDPSFKSYTNTPGIDLSIIGTNRADLLAAAGGTTNASPDYVSGLNETNLDGKLFGYTTNLLNLLKTQYPNASVEQILGSRSIIQEQIAGLGSAMPFQPTTTNDSFSAIPSQYMAKFRIAYGSVNHTIYMPDLQGQCLSLSFDNTNGVLWLEDTQLDAETNGTGATVTMTLVANQPHTATVYGGGVLVFTDTETGKDDQTITLVFKRTISGRMPRSALIYSFEPSPDLLRERQEKLDWYLAQGYADTSREVVTETLNVMGLNWFLQSVLSYKLAAQQTGVLFQRHHAAGRMSQEESYFVDVGLMTSGYFQNSGDAGKLDQFMSVGGYLASGMEHGVVEQMQNGTNQAISTIKMMEVANQHGDRIYRATAANWSLVTPQLQNYSSTNLQAIQTDLNNGAAVLLPQNGSYTINQWSGMAYASRSVPPYTNSLKLIITGGYNGGYDTSWAVVDSAPVVQFNYSTPDYFALAPVTTSQSTVADPVSVADGALTHSVTDLTVGQSTEPRGLSLTRYYNSRRHNHNLVQLGYGWTHNYDIRATQIADIQAALGLATPYELAASLVANASALSVYQGSSTAKEWATVALIAKWGVDFLRTNAVSIALGNDTVEFLRQPDGTYTPSAGLKMTLNLSNGLYVLQQRHGNAFYFNASNRVDHIADPYGKTMNFAYYTDGRLETVSDAWPRTLTFSYNGTNSLASVASSAGGGVSFGYTGSNLTSATDPENKTSTYSYDATNHQLVAQTDALNQLVTTNFYDAAGRVIEQLVQGDTNKTWQIYYTGFLNTEQDPVGSLRQFSYDDKYRLIAQQDALGNTSQTFYDGQDHVVMTVSPLNETNLFGYDGNHNLTNAIDPLGYSNQFFYDSQNNLYRSVDARGNPSTFGYNGQFSLTGSTNGAGDWVAYSYNTDGTLATRTDPGGQTSFTYDNYGQLSSVTYPGSLGGEGFFNSATGDVLSHTNARGFATSFLYNSRRQLTNTVAPTNLTVKVAYDAVGNPQSVTDARTNATTSFWSPARHLTGTILPATPQGVPATTNIYDSRDWLIQTINNPLSTISSTTSFTNDLAGLLLSATDPLVRTTHFGYDSDGRKTATTNAAQEVTLQQWNAKGQMTLLTDPATHTVQYAFDGAGNEITLTNRNGKKWQFSFDAANRLANTITPMNRTNSQVWNNRGLLQSVTDPMQQPTTFLYDGRGRLTNRTDLVGTTASQYDGNGNLTKLTDTVNSQPSTLNFAYDAYDRMSSFTNAQGYVIQYGYDPNGNLKTLVYPGNLTVTYAYDSLNRLTNVTDWLSRQTTFTYDLASRVTSITRPNGTVRLINYDVGGETTNIIEKTLGNFPIAFFTLGWTNSGRVAWEFGAPLPQTNPPPTRTMSFDDDNRLKTFNSQTVTNDADGNLTWGPLTNNTLVSYGYDARNRLLAAGGFSYGYDPAGNRTSVTSGTNIAQFVINPNAKLPQLLMRITGGTTHYYIHGLGLLYEVIETATNTSTLTYHFDCRGSTVALTDQNGNVTDRIQYSAYGMPVCRTGTNDTPFLYNGRYGVMTDPNGLLYMRARYYNPCICRFVNADPSGFAGGLNFYQFANGNPVSYRDPSGLGAVGDNSGASWLNGGTPANLQDPFGLSSGQSLTGGAIGAAGVLEQAGQVRYDYNAWVAQYVTDTGGYSPTRDAIRAYFNDPANSTALSRGVADMYRWEQGLSGASSSLANPTVTAASVNNAAAIARYGGQGLMVVGTGLSVYNIATAPDPYRATVQSGSAIVVGAGGGMAGAAGGAFIGSFFGPGPGTAIGAVIGAIVGGSGGGMAGHALGTAAYDANYGPNSPWYP